MRAPHATHVSDIVSGRSRWNHVIGKRGKKEIRNPRPGRFLKMKMAKKFSYEKVDVLIVDGKSHHRSSLRHVLNDLSFCEIRHGTTRTAVQAEFAKRMPDFMIADSNLPGGTVAELITDIRHHKIGANPFLPIIVMTWDPAPN